MITYVIHIKCDYVNLEYEFTSTDEAIRFMANAVTKYIPNEEEDREYKVWMTMKVEEF